MDEPQKQNSEPQNETPQEDMHATCKTERDEYLSGWQRAKADFVNYRKDEAKRMEELAKYATRDLIEEFITSLDNFDLALGTLEKTGPVEKGIYMIRTQIEDILRKRGLTKIEVKPGDAFDPATQEAIIETESEYPEGAIVEQIECGYRLHDKVIRPARVRISKGKQ